MATLLIFHPNASGRLVHMPLHDVSVQTTAHLHGAFDIHFVAHLNQPKVGAVERLAHGGYGIGVVLDADNS